MKLKFLFIAITLSFSALVMAKEVKKTIDTDVSLVSWLGKKKILNDKHYGKIKIKDGFVVFDSKGQPLNAEVILDMTKITNEDLKDKTYNTKLVSHLSGADFFDVTKYPNATLNIKSFEKTKIDKKDKTLNLTMYKAIGELKIKDETKPVAFDVQILPSGAIYKGTGKLTIDRTLWGVKYGSDSFFKGLGDKVIANDMEFDFELATKN